MGYYHYVFKEKHYYSWLEGLRLSLTTTMQAIFVGKANKKHLISQIY